MTHPQPQNVRLASACVPPLVALRFLKVEPGKDGAFVPFDGECIGLVEAPTRYPIDVDDLFGVGVLRIDWGNDKEEPAAPVAKVIASRVDGKGEVREDHLTDRLESMFSALARAKGISKLTAESEAFDHAEWHHAGAGCLEQTVIVSRFEIPRLVKMAEAVIVTVPLGEDGKVLGAFEGEARIIGHKVDGEDRVLPARIEVIREREGDGGDSDG